MERKLKIGVMGSALGNQSKEVLEKAAEVGKAIAENGCILIFGATVGYPLEAANAAKKAGGLVVGISSAANEKEQLEKYKRPVLPSDVIVYTGFGDLGRIPVLVRSCDAVVIISGRNGTMAEFSTAYAERIPIGVLEGTGGFADRVKAFDAEVLREKYPVKIIYGQNPRELVEGLLQAVKN